MTELEAMQKRIMRYLRKHGALTSKRIFAWLQSCHSPFTFSERGIERVLIGMRDVGIISCTNGVWWVRETTR